MIEYLKESGMFDKFMIFLFGFGLGGFIVNEIVWKLHLFAKKASDDYIRILEEHLKEARSVVDSGEDRGPPQGDEDTWMKH